MPVKKAAGSTKKASSRSSRAKATVEAQGPVGGDIQEATQRALAEAAVRRDAAQSLVDEGYRVVSTADDPDKGFYFTVTKDGAEETAWMSETGKLTMEGQSA